MIEDPFAHITDEELMREISRREKKRIGEQEKIKHLYPDEKCSVCGLSSGALFWTSKHNWQHAKCPTW